MTIPRNIFKPWAGLFLTFAVFALPAGANPNFLGSCTSLLTKNGAISRVENTETGETTAPRPAMTLEQTAAALERYSLSTNVRAEVIEILPDGNGTANQLARAAYILGHDPVYLSKAYPNGFKIVIDPTLQTADGFLSVKDGEIHLAAATLTDHALAFATLAHEMSNAEQLSLWLNGAKTLSPINTVARGKLPGLDGTRYSRQVSAQEMLATAVGGQIYNQYKGTSNVEMLRIGRKIARAYMDMTADILGVLADLTPEQRHTLSVRKSRTVSHAGQVINVDFTLGVYAKLTTPKTFVVVKVLKRTINGTVEYSLEIPLPTDKIALSTDELVDLTVAQVKNLRGQSLKYFADFKY